MNKLEDAPKELQDMFATVWEYVVCSASGISDYRDEIEHVFLKGFDVAMATGGMRPKRTIATFHNSNNHIGFFVISNDGRMFRWLGEETGWQPLPNLPQG